MELLAAGESLDSNNDQQEMDETWLTIATSWNEFMRSDDISIIPWIKPFFCVLFVTNNLFPDPYKLKTFYITSNNFSLKFRLDMPEQQPKYLTTSQIDRVGFILSISFCS